MDVNEELKFLCKIQKKIGGCQVGFGGARVAFGGSGWGGSGWM